jgi:hypothetical protein
MGKMISLQEAAKRHGVSVRRMQALCAKRQVTGARLVGRSWLVPSTFKVTPGVPGRPPEDEEKAHRRRLLYAVQGAIDAIREASDVEESLDELRKRLPEIERLNVEVEDPIAVAYWEIVFRLTNKRPRR